MGEVPNAGTTDATTKSLPIWELRLPADASPLLIARHRINGLGPVQVTLLSLLLKLKSKSDGHGAEHRY